MKTLLGIFAVIAFSTGTAFAEGETVADYAAMAPKAQIGATASFLQSLKLPSSEDTMAKMMVCMNHIGEDPAKLGRPLREGFLNCLGAIAE